MASEMIDSLVSKGALDSLEQLNKDLASSYEEMERVLKILQELNKEFSKGGKTWSEYSKDFEKAEEAFRAKAKAEKEYAKTAKDIRDLTEEVIKSENKRTKSSEESSKAAEEQTKANEKTRLSIEQLLNLVKEASKGIDISAFIKTDDSGLKSYSSAIQVLNQEIGRLTGLRAELSERFREGAITEQELDKSITLLTTKQKEYEQTLDSLTKKYEKTGEAQRSIFDVSGKTFANLEPEIQKMITTLVKENIELNEVRDAQKNLNKEYKDGKISLDIYIEKKSQLNSLEYELSESVKKLSNELQLNKQILKSAAGSYEKISAQYSLMKIQINALGEAEGKSAEAKRKLEAQANSLYNRMNELQKATGKAQLQVGNYELANKGLGESLKGISGSLKGLEGALNQVSPAVGGVVSGIIRMTEASLVFIATPLGIVLAAIAAALALVYSWFERTEEGANSLTIATEAFSTVLNQVYNIATQLGEILVKVFIDPKVAVKELGDLIVSHIITRVKAIFLMMTSITEMIEGDWKTGIKDFNDALHMSMSGIEKMTDKVGKSVAIQKALNDLATQKRDLSVEEARKQAEINRLRNEANDQTKSSADRQKALNAYTKIENDFAKKKIALLKEERSLTEQKIKNNKGNLEYSKKEKEDLAKLDIAIFNAEADHEQKMYIETRLRNSLKREGERASKEAMREMERAEKEAMRERNKDIKALAELETFEYQKIAEIQKKISEDETVSFEERRAAFRYYIDDSIAAIEKKAEIEMNVEGLTENQRKLIREKALYEIFKLEEEYAKGIKNLNIKEVQSQVDKVKEIISEKSEAINEAMQKDLLFAAKVYGEQMSLALGNEKERKKITEDYQRQRLEISKKYSQEQLEFEIAKLQELLETVDFTEKEKINITKRINDLKKTLIKDIADYEIGVIEDTVNKQKTIEEEFNEFMRDRKTQAVMTMWGQISDIANSYYDNELKRIDELENREKEYYEEKNKLIDNSIQAGLMSQEEADARKRVLEAEKIEREKKIEAERKKTQKKQAEWQKANSIIQATISTAQAVASALSMKPTPVGIAFAAIVGALGAIQIAKIASQKIPSYREGTEGHPGGWAIVGDGGRSEMAILPGGGIWQTPARDTLACLPKGTEILPDFKQALMNIYPIDLSKVEKNNTSDSMNDKYFNQMNTNMDRMAREISAMAKEISATRMNSRYMMDVQRRSNDFKMWS